MQAYSLKWNLVRIFLLLLTTVGLFAQAGTTPTARYATVADMVADKIPNVPVGVSGKMTALVTGRVAANDGGGGMFFFVPGSAAITNLGTVFPANGAGRWFRNYDKELNILWFGAIGDDTTDAYLAFRDALLLKEPLYVPYGTYKITNTLDIVAGSVRGSSWDTGAEEKTVLRFYNQTSVTNASVRFTSNDGSLFPVLKDIMILASSWDATTGALGFGIMIVAPAKLENVYVGNFQKSNIILLADVSKGPYQSVLQNVYSAYSGEHGCVVGTGANNVSLFNYEGKWNGAPTFGTQPSVAGSFDGLHVSRDGAGNPGNAYPSYLMQNLVISGGDCSYNSGYGWNFRQIRDSVIFPGYAEGNLSSDSGQARIGADVQTSSVFFTTLQGGASSISLNNTFTAYNPNNLIWYGGKLLGSGNPDGSSYLLMNMTNILSRTIDTTTAITMRPEGGSAPSGGLNITGGGRLNIDVAGVAINGTNALSNLDIIDNSSSYSAALGAFLIRNASDSNQRLYMGFDPSVGTDGVSFIQSIEAGVGNRPLLLNAQGANVVINTTNSISPLTLQSATTATSSEVGAFSIINSSDDNIRLVFGYDTSVGTGGNGSGWIRAVKSGTGHGDLLLNAPGGNVGVGGTLPTSKFAVANGDIQLATEGYGIKIKEGSNAKMGQSTLANGTVTVANTSVTASSRIFLTRDSINGSTTIGSLEVGTITASTSFVINSYDAAASLSADDDSIVNWVIIEPSP